MAVGEEVLERDAERAAIDAAVAAAAVGDGALVLVTGAAGTGKSTLLRLARERAAAAGFTVLPGAASELDRGFPFGLAHQLLDGVLLGAAPDRRARLLAGAARHAAAVLDPAAARGPDDADPGFAALQGLYWLVANLAEEGPVALVADDLHWADRPSLRLLEYLGRRLEGLRVLVVGAARPTEPGADTELLAELGAGPSARVLRPGPLSAAGAGAVVAAALGTEPDPAFAQACATATGGNPLLLRTLARQAVEHGLTGRADEADRVAELGAEGLAPVVQRRLVALGPDAGALARAAVVLGERHRLDRLAAVAGLEPARAARAADDLVAAGLLEPQTWSFVQPVVRTAVAGTLAPAETTRLHAVAARLLQEAGARPDEVAAHLVRAEPARNPEVVATLRAAARAAVREGAPEAAVAFLRRALAEPPPVAEEGGLLLELGELEVRVQEVVAAAEHLTAALGTGLTGDAAARARAARAGVRMLAEPEPAIAELEAARGEATDPALRLRIEALLLDALTFSSWTTGRRAALLDAARADPAASSVLLAALAHEAGFTGAPAGDVVGFARRAMTEGDLLEVVGSGTSTFGFLIHALRLAEKAELAMEYVERSDRSPSAARAPGTANSVVDNLHAYWHLSFGSVAVGLGRAETALARARAGGLTLVVVGFAAPAADLLIEQDRLADAAALLDEVDAALVADTLGEPFLLAARGEVRRREHRTDEAEADLRAAVAALDERGWTAPLLTGARLRLARLLAERGRRDEALERAEAAAATAERAGTRGALGAALRVQALAAGGDEGVALLEEAVAALAESPLRLEHGWALHDLGAALRRTGRRADARVPLREAVDAAARTEAVLLGRMAREELAATGARVLRETLTGPSALTPAERRVAELAADGRSNREIAETLWVTRKTVEVHLGKAYAKLGIRARGQLAEALRTDA